MSTTDPFEARRKKRDAIRALGINPYPERFMPSHRAEGLQDHYKDLADGTETEDVVVVAGRIMALRNDGMFIDLMDTSGKIQVFSHKDSLSEEYQRLLPLLDLGDIIGVKGTIRRTPRGELSVRASELTMLTKTMLILPEKYHGLSDIETRYRQRYMDLIVNEDSLNVLRKRARMTDLIRRYLQEVWGGIEVETPVLHAIHGGAAAKPFVTHHNALDSDFYLRIATELHLKRLMVGGFSDCVFEIGRLFRNEGISVKHNPEFTTFELYKLYATRDTMMDIVEGTVRHLAQNLNGSTTIHYQGKELETGKPWPRLSMPKAVQDATGIDFMAIKTDAEARDAARAKGFKIQERMRWGEVINFLFEETVEGKLEQPTHIIDHPLDISPLAKQQDDEPRLTSRFESFVNGWEIANGFSELNDPDEQRRRFEMQMEDQAAGNDEAHQLDEDFITALGYGMPPTGGLGMGMDRLAMILTDTTNIRDVINFPTLRPISVDGHKRVSRPANQTTPDDQPVQPGQAPSADETRKRFVVVVNEKVTDTGKLMNAIGHAMAGLSGKLVGTEDACFVDYIDGDGGVHPAISHYPVIVLKAKNSNAIAKVRAEAAERNMPFTDFLTTMQIGKTQEQLDATAQAKGEGVEYMALCLFGDTEVIRGFTGKLSLYK